MNRSTVAIFDAEKRFPSLTVLRIALLTIKKRAHAHPVMPETNRAPANWSNGKEGQGSSAGTTSTVATGSPLGNAVRAIADNAYRQLGGWVTGFTQALAGRDGPAFEDFPAEYGRAGGLLDGATLKLGVGLTLEGAGFVGAAGGGAVSGTGVGTLLGVPALELSLATIVVGAGFASSGVIANAQATDALSHAMEMRGSGEGSAGGGGRTTSQIDRASFKAEREAYWKTEAKNNPGEYTAENVKRMEKGRAPLGSDGHPMELHHVDRTPEGGVKPMTRTEHRLGENYKKNHTK